MDDKIKEQGEKVKALKALKKAGDASFKEEDLASAIAALKELKAAAGVDTGSKQTKKKKKKKQKDQAEAKESEFTQLLTRKMFVVTAFEIYNGVKGLYDLGPPGSALMANIQQVWRSHFVDEEQMLEMACTAMTPHDVLKTSGHVDKFQDFMVTDAKTNDYHRADHLLEDHIDAELAANPGLQKSDPKRHAMLLEVRSQADAFSVEELGEQMRRLGVLSPEGNEVTAPFPFNLMFVTQIGPTGKLTGYLRPETAQGLFVNFNRLLDYNYGQLPFAAAQIGLAFRNEIAPRAGLLRVREFTLAEIEHFVDPDDKSHPKFATVADMELNLQTRDIQAREYAPNMVRVGDAVARGLIGNETLAYFMSRTALFLRRLGADMSRVRFRQHLSTEMAHYAQDCWDAEILVSHGWVECVGHADRSCYDLTKHAEATKKSMKVDITFPEPVTSEEVQVDFNKGLMGKKLQRDNRAVQQAIADLDDDAKLALPQTLSVTLPDGRAIALEAAMIKGVKRVKVTKHSRSVVPHVIEPSFGLGRIFYCILEHAFDNTSREEAGRSVLKFVPLVAPYKVALLTLQNAPEFVPHVQRLQRECVARGLQARTDLSKAAIGKKYARTEELGVPFCVTVDFDTAEKGTVTLRERDSMQQVYVPIDRVVDILAGLCSQADATRTTWAEDVWASDEFKKVER